MAPRSKKPRIGAVAPEGFFGNRKSSVARLLTEKTKLGSRGYNIKKLIRGRGGIGRRARLRI